MNTSPLVSVIIPAFNAQSSIAKTLDSILAQTYRSLEIIVVDDGSTDDTAAIVKGYGERVQYYYQNNSGGCAVPRNTGIKHSSGSYLCFFDADDLMVCDRIAGQVEFMERNPEVGLVFCDYRNLLNEVPYSVSHFQTCSLLGQKLQNKQSLTLEEPNLILVQENFGSAGSLLIRRDALKHAEHFEPTLKACEDFHFYYRIARRTPVGIVNKVGTLRRLHGNNMSGNLVRMLSEGIRSRSMLRDNETDARLSAGLNRYIADSFSSLARYYADNTHFALSFQAELKALTSQFQWSRAKKSFRNIARTMLIAARLHKPT